MKYPGVPAPSSAAPCAGQLRNELELQSTRSLGVSAAAPSAALQWRTHGYEHEPRAVDSDKPYFQVDIRLGAFSLCNRDRPPNEKDIYYYYS